MSDISDVTRRVVWVRAGGRCVICKAYLLDETSSRVVPFGEVAHNIGGSDGEASPRRVAGMQQADRDAPDNLLLLCHGEHKVIDDRVLRDDYTIEQLRELKQAHEHDIKQLTGLIGSPRTLVLRVRGEVRGATPGMTRDDVAPAVLGQRHLPRYAPWTDTDGIEVDLTHHVEEGATYWPSAAEAIATRVERIRQSVRSEEHRHVSVFALARIPLLVHLGRCLDDTFAVDIHQLHRSTQSWVPSDSASPATFTWTGPRDRRAGSDALLVVSASGTVHPNNLPAGVAEMPTWTLAVDGETPHVDIAEHPETLGAFNQTLRVLLADLEAHINPVRTLHIVTAAPVSLAVALGRALDPQLIERIALWDRAETDAPNTYTRVLDLVRDGATTPANIEDPA